MTLSYTALPWMQILKCNLEGKLILVRNTSLQDTMEAIHDKIEKYKLTCKIIEAKGYCIMGHKVGEEFEISMLNAGKMCGAFYHATYPEIQTLQLGGALPWEQSPDLCHPSCPDQHNLVTAEIRRTLR